MTKIVPDYTYTDWKAGDIGINKRKNMFLFTDDNTFRYFVSNKGTEFNMAQSGHSKTEMSRVTSPAYIGNISDLGRILQGKIDFS